MRSALIVFVVTFASLPIVGQDYVVVASRTQPSKHAFRPEWNTELSVTNNVVWRGFLSNRSTTLQPVLTLSMGSFSVSSTSALEFDGQYCWKEHDLQVSYTKEVAKRWSLTSGYINYAYPALHENRFAHEFFIALAMEGPVGLELQAYQDAGMSSGSYLNVAVEHSFRSTNRFPINVSASLGYNRKLFIPESTLSDALLTVSTPMKLRSGLAIEPQIGYSKGLNSRYFSDYLTIGVRLSYEPKRQDAGM